MHARLKQEVEGRLGDRRRSSELPWRYNIRRPRRHVDTTTFRTMHLRRCALGTLSMNKCQASHEDDQNKGNCPRSPAGRDLRG